MPQHHLADFEPCLEYATKGQAVGGIPMPNTLKGPQFRPQPQPLHFAVGRAPPAMVEKGKLALDEYRSGVIDILLGRRAIWREGVLILNLHIMGASVLPKSLPTISEVG